MALIETGFAQIKIQGDRLPASVLAMSDTGAVLGTSSARSNGMTPLPKQTNKL